MKNMTSKIYDMRHEAQFRGNAADHITRGVLMPIADNLTGLTNFIFRSTWETARDTKWPDNDIFFEPY